MSSAGNNMQHTHWCAVVCWENNGLFSVCLSFFLSLFLSFFFLTSFQFKIMQRCDSRNNSDNSRFNNKLILQTKYRKCTEICPLAEKYSKMKIYAAWRVNFLSFCWSAGKEMSDHSRQVGPHVTSYEKFSGIARKFAYLLLKRRKGCVCLVLVPSGHSRRVGPHVTCYVRNENYSAKSRNCLTFCWSAGK